MEPTTCQVNLCSDLALQLALLSDRELVLTLFDADVSVVERRREARLRQRVFERKQLVLGHRLASGLQYRLSTHRQ